MGGSLGERTGENNGGALIAHGSRSYDLRVFLVDALSRRTGWRERAA